MNYRSLLVVALALTFGLSAAIGVNLFLRHRGSAEPVETVAVVVAAIDIPRGVTINPNQVKTREWPKSLVPPGALTNPEEVRGRVTFHPIVKGEVVLEGKLTGKDSGRGLASMIPLGMRAFTIHTPSVASGVAGFILPGNKVDVLLTISGTDTGTGGSVTTTLLQNVEILAVDQRLDPPSENRVDTRLLQSVTLLVTPDQAAKLDLGQNRGTLHLSLRNPEDTAAAKSRPATLSGLLFYQEKPSEELAIKPVDVRPVKPVELVPPPPPAVLQVRTLRGVYHGMIEID